MKKNLLRITGILTCAALTHNTVNAQISFTNKNTVLHSLAGVAGSNANTRSGNSLTVIDINGDGLDDICKLADNGEVRIEYQKPGGSYTFQNLGASGANNCWAMCMADVDKNGYKDVLLGSGNSLVLMKVNATGAMSVTTLPNSNFFQQNLNFMDVDGDGWVDIFACDDNAASSIYVNDGAGNYPAVAGSGVINFDVYPGGGTANDDSGNYGSVWTDFDNDGDVDLYIAKCRQAAGSSSDPRRRDVLFVNNGNGTYTENAIAHGLGSKDQDWTPSFGDIDNDGDFDLFLTKHNTSSAIYTNDGTGMFDTLGTIAFGSMPMQAQFEDMDNDGFVDLIISGDDDERIYLNNHNNTFTDVTPANIGNGSNILSFASGDLDHDGKIDLYASYGSTYNSPSSSRDDIFWQNTTDNGNHFLTLNLFANISNIGALGARAYIYGAWGVQTREVRAGESYGTLNSSQLHFGLGTATTVDSVVVNWPSGIHQVILNPVVDEFLSVHEQAACTLSGSTISAGGPLVVCAGGSVNLTATPYGGGSYTYLWSTGETTQTIAASNAGSYAVTVTESASCKSVSPTVYLTITPDETPTITALADTVFCQGDSVQLTSTAASSYLWSNGATTQSIYVSQAGIYTVDIQGLCQTWTSNAISVNTHPAPAPAASDVTLPAPGTATLTATGNSITWYADATGGSALATGTTYNTSTLSSDTIFYAQDAYNYGGGITYGAPKYHFGASAFGPSNANGYISFIANENCTLNKVKVYTDSAGTRIIELRNSSGVVLQSQTVNIPLDSSVVTLNFNLTAGTAYRIGTNSAQNTSNFGYISPRLRRINNSAITYPMRITTVDDTLITMTGTNPAGTVFYYFYNWEVETAPVVCTSSRTPVHVYVNAVGLKNAAANGAISIYPNPASDYVNLELKDVKEGAAVVKIYDLLGKQVYNETYKATAHSTKAISTSGLNKGVYEINVTIDGTVYHSRIVVQ